MKRVIILAVLLGAMPARAAEPQYVSRYEATIEHCAQIVRRSITYLNFYAYLGKDGMIHAFGTPEQSFLFDACMDKMGEPVYDLPKGDRR